MLSSEFHPPLTPWRLDPQIQRRLDIPPPLPPLENAIIQHISAKLAKYSFNMWENLQPKFVLLQEIILPPFHLIWDTKCFYCFNDVVAISSNCCDTVMKHWMETLKAEPNVNETHLKYQSSLVVFVPMENQEMKIPETRQDFY